jgi:hypothetical protein
MLTLPPKVGQRSRMLSGLSSLRDTVGHAHAAVGTAGEEQARLRCQHLLHRVDTIQMADQLLLPYPSTSQDLPDDAGKVVQAGFPFAHQGGHAAFDIGLFVRQ